MDDKRNTIGLTELLDEVNRDLDDFRTKHPGDYSVKNVTLWWELERERLLVRHGSAAVRKPRRLRLRLDLGPGFFAVIAALTLGSLANWLL